MTENAKIAKLWSGFHHLAEADKDLVVKIAEVVRQPEKSCLKGDRKETQDKDFHKEIKLSCG
ncbi:hypothetical protein AGMMS49587_11530 [Spirochaetia bacterium]|nr:hypothetical protein AGMMS49587_11530 [Spirochaetia bacterium]